MTGIKEQILREFGDQGADTFERYFAQIEYTAYWCIRILCDAERIDRVIPEGIEDVVVVRRGILELHQIKTRDESQGPWTTAQVLPVLCDQYHRRKAFTGEYCLHFVSNQMADAKTALRADSFGPLYRLKHLLEIEHDGQLHTPVEQSELRQFEDILIPKIQENLQDRYRDKIDTATATILLHRTWIDTDCPVVRHPDNLMQLEGALTDLFPGTLPFATVQLRQMYDNLLLSIMRRIVTGTSLEMRQIVRQDVLNCRVASCTSVANYPSLDQIPGVTTLDKKAYLGGFDLTELPVFHRQSKLAEWTMRQLESLSLTDVLNRLTTAILDLQMSCRHKICREQGINQKPGPAILSMLRPSLTPLATTYFPGSSDVDEQFCLGILWRETDLCSAWWHGLDGAVCEGAL